MNLSLLNLHFWFLFKITSVGDMLTDHDAKKLKLALKPTMSKERQNWSKTDVYPRTPGRLAEVPLATEQTASL